MKAATLNLRNTLEQEQAIYAKPRLIAEWEYNRFKVPTVTVSPDQTGDDEWKIYYGDIDSVALPNRPNTGIAKARSDNNIMPEGKYRDTPISARYYPSGSNDPYDYFSSVQRSSLVESANGYEFDTPITVTVTYPEAVEANKIVVGFETSYAKPSLYSIQITPDGTGWYTIASNGPVDSYGMATLYYDGKEWGFSGPVYDQVAAIAGVRISIYAMDTPFAHADVLQVGARLENDLSDFVVSYTTQLEVSDRSFIAPMGKASANQATVTLSNIDGRFNNDNADSLYYGMIDKKVKFMLDLGIDTTPQGGTGYEYIREFTMWTDNWGQAATSQTNLEVQLKDSAVILQERAMISMFMENASVGAVIWTIMDRLGMTNYNYTRAAVDNSEVIPYYWPDITSSSTVWDEISAISEGTQTAVFFDEYDILQIRPREEMYSEKSIDWNFDAVQNGAKMPEIVDLQVNDNLEVNQVDINYKPAYLSDDQNGFPKMEQAWQPQNTTDTSSGAATTTATDTSTVTLRATALVNGFVSTDTYFTISKSDAVFWPYESDVNIEGEILHYKGKEYGYYRADGALMFEYINSLDDKNNRDALSPALSWKNYFSGRLKVTDRALYGSLSGDHRIVKQDYTELLTSWENDVFQPWSGNVTQQTGYITMTNPCGQTWNGARVWDHVYLLRKSPDVVMPQPGSYTLWYGTKIRFPNTADATPTSNGNIGGIYFAGDWGDAGYFLEMCTTAQIDGWENRQWRNELCLFAMPGDAPVSQIPTHNEDHAIADDPKGARANVMNGVWYTLDVSYTHNPGSYVQISAYLNGVPAGVWRIDASQIPLNEGQGRFGTFTRGPSTVDYEYLYAFAQDDTNPVNTPDATAFLDLKTGSFTSGFLESEIKYNFRTIDPSYTWPTGPVYFPQRIDDTVLSFDEFGPVVHEVRKFNVTFDTSKAPVVSSYLYLSNTSQVTPLYYESDAFSAEFMLANSSRDIAIVNGEDTLTFGADNSVTQSMFVYGRSVYQDQQKTVSKQSDTYVRIRGASKTTFESRYVQTDSLANGLGDFVVTLWGEGADETVINCFGNPLVQIGDLVTINWPLKGMSPATHKYFVVQVQGDFQTGYKSTFTLRRARV